jgi:hypothetical protein
VNAVQVIAGLVSLGGLFVAVRSLVRLRASLRAERRDSIAELFEQPETQERVREQVEAEDQIPW